MGRNGICVDAWIAQSGTWAVFEQDGIAYTCQGLPNQDEADHVRDYHAGKYCPLMVSGGTACATFEQRHNGAKRRKTCFEQSRAGKW